jgi:hypothetical protein
MEEGKFLAEYQPLVYSQMKKMVSMSVWLMLIFLKGTMGPANMK